MNFPIDRTLRDFAFQFLQLDSFPKERRERLEKLKAPFKEWVNHNVTNPEKDPMEAFILFCVNAEDYSKEERLRIGEKIEKDLRNYNNKK